MRWPDAIPKSEESAGVTVDRFDERAAELIGCSIPGVCKAWAGHPLQVNGHLDRCVASLRPAIAQALRDGYAEGVKDSNGYECENHALGTKARCPGCDDERMEELREGAKRARRECEHAMKKVVLKLDEAKAIIGLPWLAAKEEEVP